MEKKSWKYWIAETWKRGAVPALTLVSLIYNSMEFVLPEMNNVVPRVQRNVFNAMLYYEMAQL